MAFRFEQLEVWQKAILFSSKIYSTTQSFPQQELFSLGNQLRRSANSISANIAEGSGSSTKKDFAHYLDIARKSCYETVSHLFIAKEQKYLSHSIFEDLYSQAELLSKMIQSFRLHLLENPLR